MKRYSTIMSVLLTLALPVAGSCADAAKMPEKGDAAVEAITGDTAKHPMMTGDGSAEAGNSDQSGRVVETMKVAGYIYANLEKDGTKTWVAYQGTAPQVGDAVSLSGCMLMTDFESKKLNRKFDTIFFCASPKPATKAVTQPPKKSHAANAIASGKAAQKIKVEKGNGANAYTVAEIFAKSAALDGKQVVVRGQVVKVSSGIMKRTWVHLQDGSGDAKRKTNDLMVTTSESAEVGDVITVSGTLVKDRDFGSGYKYSAIIERASLKK